MNVVGQVIGVLEPENQKINRDVLRFLRRSTSHSLCRLPPRPFRVVWLCTI